MKTEPTPLVFVTTTPQVGELLNLYQSCSPITEFGFDRMSDPDAVRYAKWENQFPDAKKHGTKERKAMPWEGASDTRVLTADDVINETTSVKELAFQRALLRPQAVDVGDMDEAGHLGRLMEWVVSNRIAGQLACEMPMSAQYWDTYGWVVLRITWEQEIRLRYRTVTMEEIAAIANRALQQDGDGPMARLPEHILLPAMDDATALIFEAIWLRQVDENLGAELAQRVRRPAMQVFRAAVKGLRDEQRAVLPVPYLAKNDPCITALKPWEDVFVPPHTTDIQKAQCVFHREFVSEVDLRARVLTDGYNETWVEEAVKTKGMVGVWSVTQGDRISPATFGQIDSQQQHIEVLHAYCRMLDENGVIGIWCTSFSPHIKTGDDVTNNAAKHELVDYPHGDMPFVVGKREHTCRRICDSRGIPELVWCAQREQKVQRDSIVDNTSFSTIPPILVPMNRPRIVEHVGNRGGAMATQYSFGPAFEVPYRPGAEPKFMDRPPVPVVAFQLIELLARQINNRFGLMRADVDPTLRMTIQQRDVNGFLTMWRLAFAQAFSLCKHYIPPAEFARITGVEPKPETPTEEERNYDTLLSFDVRELDVDHTAKKLEAFTKIVLPIDAGGTIDRTKLVRVLTRAIDPTLVRELLQDQTAASRALFDRVQQEIALMALGNELPYTEDVDPTAARQLEYSQQIIFGDQMGRGGNPHYQQLLQKDKRFADLFENWRKNKMHSLTQIENQQIGRTGVERVG